MTPTVAAKHVHKTPLRPDQIGLNFKQALWAVTPDPTLLIVDRTASQEFVFAGFCPVLLLALITRAEVLVRSDDLIDNAQEKASIGKIGCNRRDRRGGSVPSLQHPQHGVGVQL